VFVSDAGWPRGTRSGATRDLASYAEVAPTWLGRSGRWSALVRSRFYLWDCRTRATTVVIMSARS
jgi:hypothetical protein